MANELIPFDTHGAGSPNVPAHLTALYGDDSNIAPRSSIDRLSYRGKTWLRIVGGEETMLTRTNNDGEEEPLSTVSLVVLDYNRARSRAYYAGAYEEGKSAPPSCYSADGVTPDATVKEPCAATCATCPNSVKGSKITENNKAVTACTVFKRVAVIPSANIGQHPVMFLRLAQTSIWDKDNAENESKGWYAWDQYLDMLRARGVKHTAVVETRVRFDMRTAYPKLLFSAAGWLSPDAAVAVKQELALRSDAIKEILTGTVTEDTADQPATQPTPPAEVKSAPSPKPAPSAKTGNTAPTTPKQAPKPMPKPAAPQPAAKTMTEKADGFTYEQMTAEGWTDEALIAEGYMVVQPATEAKAPVPKPAAPKPPAAPKVAAAPKAAPAPVSEAPAAVSEAPADLASLLEGWDDDQGTDGD